MNSRSRRSKKSKGRYDGKNEAMGEAMWKESSDKSDTSEHSISADIMKCCSSINWWKMAAIAMILVFVIIIISGVIRVNKIRPSFEMPTQEQNDIALQLAGEKLNELGLNASDFKAEVGQIMRMPEKKEGKYWHRDEQKKQILQVAFSNNSTTHTFLVDINSSMVLLHSQTDFYVMPEDGEMPVHNCSKGGPGIIGKRDDRKMIGGEIPGECDREMKKRT